MKHRKLTALLLAAAAALTPVTAAAAQIPLHAFAADVGVVDELPEFIPDDYYSAVKFRNDFGGSMVGSGLICLVFPEEIEDIPEGEPRGVLRYNLAATSGIAKCLKDAVYSVEGSSLGLRVAVYQPTRQGTLNVTHTDTWQEIREGSGSASDTYTFLIEEINPEYHTLSVSEIGFSSWLPDCREEYDRYVKEHGPVSLHENCVIFCMSAGIGTAYEWREKSTDYTKNFEYRKTISCDTVSGTPDVGGTSCRVVVYEACADGHAAIEWEYGSFLAGGEVSKTLKADCMVTDNAQNVLLPHMMRIEFMDAISGFRANIPSVTEPVTLSPSAVMIGLAEGGDIYTAMDVAPVTADCNPFIWDCTGLEGCRVGIDLNEAALPKNYRLGEGDYKQVTEYPNGAHNVAFFVRYGETVEGDLNGDGEFTVADAVLLCRWLLGQSDAALTNWRAADFSKDGRLNAADLTLMKRALINANTIDSALIVIDRENAWVQAQQTYFFNRAMLSEIPEAVSLIEKISAKTDVLEHADTITWDYPIADYGVETLSLPVKDENGGISRFRLAGFGSGSQVLDDPDVLALVRLLSEKDIFGLAGGFDFDESAARSAPVAVTIQQRGGFAGVNNLWRIFKKDGICTVSITDRKSDAGQQEVAVIGEAEYQDFMAQDFTQYYNQADPAAQNWDAFYYNTVYTYEGGITRTSKANVTELRFALEDLIYGTPLND